MSAWQMLVAGGWKRGLGSNRHPHGLSSRSQLPPLAMAPAVDP